MLEKEKIDRINALAKMAKSAEGLTEEEAKERASLREEYLQAVRAHMTNTLERVRIVEPDGSITVPKKKEKPLN